MNMDITNILNTKGSAAAAAAAAAANPEQQLHQQLAQVTGRPSSTSGSERATSPHNPEFSTRFLSRPNQPMHVVSGMQDGLHYPSPSQLNAPLPMLQTGMVQTNGYENGYGHDSMRATGRPPSDSPTQKAFPCGTCGKGFARRSDLARHGELCRDSWTSDHSG